MLCFAAGSSPGLEVMEPGYTVDILATYSEPELDRVKGLAIDDSGNLYIPHMSSRVIYKVTPAGVASEFIRGIDRPDGIVWADGSKFGDYLYLVRYETWGGEVVRIGLDGSISNFGNMPSGGHAGSCIGLDVTGNYNGDLYVGSTGQDHIYRVNSSGHITMWSNFHGWIDGGGPTDICFDPTGDYGDRMFVSTSFKWTPSKSGLFVLDTGGNASRFAPDIIAAQAVAFDPYDLFGSGLFTIAPSSSTDENAIWAVATDGSITKFATGELASRGLDFGPDGAMYVTEYIREADKVIISRICRYAPVQIAVDIKPGSCPNPLNPNSRGVLPMAVLGTGEFDVTSIDVASLRLAGVAPIRSHYEDVATPVYDSNDCECNEEGSDGFIDLMLHFKTKEMTESIIDDWEDVNRNDEIKLILQGELTDGTMIEGSDCIVVVGKVPPGLAAKKADLNEDGGVDFLDLADLSKYWLKKAVVDY